MGLALLQSLRLAQRFGNARKNLRGLVLISWRGVFNNDKDFKSSMKLNLDFPKRFLNNFHFMQESG